LIMDNAGMNHHQLEGYFDLYRKPNKKYNVENRKDTGVHGLGAKEADIVFCNKNKIIILSKKTNDSEIIGKIINFKQIIIDCSNHVKEPYTDNLLDISNNEIELFKNYMQYDKGTLFIYDLDTPIESSNLYENIEKNCYHRLGLTFYNYLKNDEMKIFFNDKEVEMFDFMYMKELQKHYPNLEDNEKRKLHRIVNFDIYKKDNIYYLITEYNKKKEYFKYGKRFLQVNRPFHQFGRSYEHLITSKIELVYLAGLANCNISNEKKIFNRPLCGCIIKRNGRVMTDGPILPRLMRINENKYLR
ncbi:uncharacterized protein METZ01_LOCUS376563, partial [marine metagenome]